MLWHLLVILTVFYQANGLENLSSKSHSIVDEASIRKIISSLMKEEGIDNISLFKVVADLKTEVEGQNAKINNMESIIARQADDITDLKERLEEVERMNEELRIVNVPEVNSAKLSNYTLTNTEHIASGRTNMKLKSESNQMEDNLINRRIRSPSERNVAFTAYLDHEITGINPGMIIKCNQIIQNYGNGYNKFTGIFTAPVSGTYYATFTILGEYKKTNVRLLKDGVNVVGVVVHPDPSGAFTQTMGSNSAVIDLSAGQSLWLESIFDHDGELFSSENYRLVTFTAFLLF